MDGKTAAEVLGCGEDETEYQLRWQILSRMHFQQDFRDEVVKHYNPPYYN